MKYYVYTYLIYSQKLIVKPEVIDSLIRAIAIKLTRQKKTRSSPIPSPLKTNTLYHRSSFQILVQKKRNKKKRNKSRNKAKHTSITSSRDPLHHFVPDWTETATPHISLLPPPLATPFSSCMQRVQAVNKENDDDTPPLEVFGKLNINEARRKWQSGGVHVGSARAGPRCVYECGPIRLLAEEDPRRKRRREHTWQVARNRATRVTHTVHRCHACVMNSRDAPDAFGVVSWGSDMYKRGSSSLSLGSLHLSSHCGPLKTTHFVIARSVYARERVESVHNRARDTHV